MGIISVLLFLIAGSYAEGLFGHMARESKGQSVSQSPIDDNTRIRRNFTKDGDYSMMFGFELDKSCFDEQDWPNKIAKAKLFEKTYFDMLHGIDICEVDRGFPKSAYGLGKILLSKIKLVCKDAYHASGQISAAAYASGGKLIGFMQKCAIQEPAIWFHEVLHLAGSVDNLTYENHNKIANKSISEYEKKELMYKDRVYFWEKHCFAPKQNIMTIKDSSKRPIDSCTTPLRYSERDTNYVLNDAEVTQACSYYDKYFYYSEEIDKILYEKILPEILEPLPEACDFRRQGGALRFEEFFTKYPELRDIIITKYNLPSLASFKTAAGAVERIRQYEEHINTRNNFSSIGMEEPDFNIILNYITTVDYRLGNILFQLQRDLVDLGNCKDVYDHNGPCNSFALEGRCKKQDLSYCKQLSYFKDTLASYCRNISEFGFEFTACMKEQLGFK